MVFPQVFPGPSLPPNLGVALTVERGKYIGVRDNPRTGRPIRVDDAEHYYRCALCGAWVDRVSEPVACQRRPRAEVWKQGASIRARESEHMSCGEMPEGGAEMRAVEILIGDS
jgi:hypothetical protein